jgi:nitrate reductase assembly molybdenum cofactor insertion protein NarJ
VKQGYFEDEDFKAFMEELPDYLRDPVMLAFMTGWRRE